MTEATTNIIITAKDQTAQAFASVNSGLSGLASGALRATTALSAIGAGAVVGSMAAFAKQTIDAQDELFKLSQKTGIAVESLAGLEFAAEQSGVELEKVAKATRTFGLLVAEAADESSASAKKLQQLGLSYKQLKDLSPEKQLLALADALGKFSKEDRVVAFTSIFGNKMADLIPLLSGGSKGLSELIEQGRKLNPVTEESARKSEQFNDQLNLLNKSVSALGREMVQGIIPSLSRVTDEMVKVTQQSGFLSGAMAGVKQLFVESFGNPKILGDVGQIRREIIKTEEAISRLSGKKDSVFFDKNALEHEREKLAQLKIDLQGAIDKSRESIKVQDESTASAKKFVIETDDGAKKLNTKKTAQDALNKAQSDALRVEGEYIKLLQHERKLREDFLRPYQQEAKSQQERLKNMQEEQKALALSRRQQISLEHAIEETTIARLQEKKAMSRDTAVITAINQEIAARKQIINVIRDTEKQTDRTALTTRNATDEVSQLWIQAGRNIQSTLATSIFNFFDDGLKGMVKNVAVAVGRIASEFAALKIAQSIGLDRMFGMPGSVGSASSSLGFADMASNAMGMFRSGGTGMANMIGRAGSVLPGSAGSFFGGMSGGTAATAARGATTLWGASGMTGAASAGAGMSAAIGAAAGPLMLAFAATQGLRALAGDKRMGGGFGKGLNAIGDIPIIGDFIPVVPLMNTLFGRGPMKFRQQSLQGTITDDGFQGDITNVFRSKGGLFLGNKHQTVTEQLSRDMQDTFDSTIKGFASSTKQAAEVLGLSSSFIDTYNKEIQIKSEKGEKLTEEAINAIFENLDNEFAKGVLANVDDFRKIGEDSSATLQRLSVEFVGLEAGARNLGASAELAKNLVNELSISSRTSLVDMLGGTDALLQKTQFFFNNFLTSSDRFAAASGDLSKQLESLGLSSNLSKEAFAEMVQAAGTSNELRTALLNLQDAFLLVTTAADANSKLLIEGAMNLGASSEFANQLISGMSKESQAAFIEMAGGVEAFQSGTSAFSEKVLTESERTAIKTSVLATELSKLGLTADISRDSFFELLRSAEIPDQLRAGMIKILPTFLDVNESVDKLNESFKVSAGTIDAANRRRQQERINDLLKIADNAISGINQGIQKFLDLSKSVKDAVTDIIPQSIEEARSAILGQINTDKKGNAKGVRDINSFDSGALSTLANQSSAGFSSRLDFERSRGRNLEILTLLDQAINKSIDGEREAARVFNTERNGLLKKLPSFDVGGIVPKSGLAIVHKGERVINPQQNEAIVQLLQQLIAAVKSGGNYTKSMSDLFHRMTNDGQSLKTVAA